MPKVKTEKVIVAQRQRQQISKKSEKYGPSAVYLQVLGSGARGVPNTLYLFSDQKCYLFNCGEGSQRLAHEHKVKLSRLNHIFITNKTWQNIGGLPGLSLTLQDVGVPNITLHGPEGLDELYNATKRFVIMKEMNVAMAKCSPSKDFEDNVMSVKYILMDPQDNILEMDPKPVNKRPKLGDTSSSNEFEEFINDDTDYYKRGRKNSESQNVKQPKSDKDLLKTKDELEEKVLRKLQKHNNCTVAYICTIKKRFGTLDLEKCVQFGVKPGPLLGQLKSGQDIVLPDGTLVKSKDVKTPDDPGPVFIVLEIPELSYLKESEFAAHFDNGANPPENIPTVIVHYTPPHIFNHPTYRGFMSMFGPTTRHLVLNSQNSCLGSESVHRTQHKLHLLDSDMFPLLRDVSIPPVWTPLLQKEKPTDPLRLRALEELKNNVAMAQFQDIINLEGSCGGDAGLNNLDPAVKLELIAGRTLSIFHLRPKKGLDRSVEPKLHIQEYFQETMDVDGFIPSLEHFRQKVEDTRYAKSGSQKEYPKVVFLGTGSCIPSKTRNTSAIVLHVDKNRSILLDCGEGTYGQLVRFYGPKRVNEFLRSLKAIYVSHLHADHHIGLIGLLQARRQALAETNLEEPITPLYLLAPGQIMSWLSIYDQRFERIRGEFTLIPNQNLLESKLSESTNRVMTSAVLASIGVQYIRTCLVAHCPNAFGVAIDVDQEYKITYSGDTIPCEKLVNIGQNSTLLIHEATMEDELANEARVKMHSTTSQAIEIGRKMNAKYTILTHFSQRYARLPRLNAHILNDNNRVGIAFDNMQVTMSDLELLPHMYAPLQLMFAEHCVELELKAAHRARQKERRPSPPKSPSIAPRKKSPRSAARSTPVIGEEHSSSSRKTSPSCEIVSAAPENDGHVTIHFKDSHASRLRRQRGRATAKIISELRSKSCSPDKNNSGSNSHASSPCRIPFVFLQRSPAPSRTSQSSSTVKNNNQTKCQNGLTTKPTSVIDTRFETLQKVPISTSSLSDGEKISNNTNSYNLNSGKGNTQPSVKKSQSPVISFRTLEKQPIELSSNKQNIQPRTSTNVVPSSSKVKTNSNSRTNMSAVMKTVSKPNPVKPVTQLPIYSNSRQQSPQRNPNDNTCLKSYNQLKPTHVAYTRNTTNWNAGPTLRNRMPQVQTLTSKKENIKTQSNSSSRERSIERKRKSPLPVKNFPYNSSKSFKPKLEDIKSSYLLLNSNNNKKINNQVENANNKVIKSLQLSDQQRKEKLLQAMKKFKSKSYWNDSKYDKIEGLNWITWK